MNHLSWMQPLAILPSLFGIAFWLSRLGRCTPAASLAASPWLAGMFVYFAMLAGVLQPVGWLVVYGGGAAFLLALGLAASGRGTYRRFLHGFCVPAALFPLLVLICVAFLHRHSQFSFLDEFVLWGLRAYDLIHIDAFRCLDPKYYSFSPYSGLALYLMGRFVDHREAVLIVMQALLLLSGLPLLLRSFSWRRWHLALLTTVAYLLAIACFGSLIHIMNDSLAGVATAAVVLAMRPAPGGRRRDRFLAIPILFGLTLLKPTSPLLAVAAIAAGLAGFMAIRLRPNRRRLLWVASLLIVVGVAYASWRWFIGKQSCEQGAFVSTFSMESARRLIGGLPTPLEKRIVDNFYHEFLTQKSNKLAAGPVFRPVLPDALGEFSIRHWFWLLLVGGVFAVFLKTGRSRKRFIGTYGVSWLLLWCWLAAHLFAYLFFFSTYEAVEVASFPRYISTYLLFLALLLVDAFAGAAAEARRRTARMALAALILGCLYIYLFENPSPYLVPKPRARFMDTADLEFLRNRLTPGARVWIVTRSPDGLPEREWDALYVSAVWRFLLVEKDIVFNRWDWMQGKPDYRRDIWSPALTPSAWSRLLRREGYGYVYLYEPDADFRRVNARLFAPDSGTGDKLFTVAPLGRDSVELLPVR